MSTEWLDAWAGVRRNEPLARHSQFGIGGPADVFLRVDDLALVPELVARCTETAVPLTILGAGSNALILDGGVRGLALRVAVKDLDVADGSATLAAGTMLPRAALDLARRGWAGMEWGIGVPGSCGASIWGNAGAFGGDVEHSLAECEVAAPDGTTRWIAAADCAFGYRVHAGVLHQRDEGVRVREVGAFGEMGAQQAFLGGTGRAEIGGQVQQAVRVDRVHGHRAGEVEVQALAAGDQRHPVGHLASLRAEPSRQVLDRGHRDAALGLRVQLEAVPGDLHLVRVLELGQRVFQAALADVAPRADDVGPDLDLHHSDNPVRTLPVPRKR